MIIRNIPPCTGNPAPVPPEPVPPLDDDGGDDDAGPAAAQEDADRHLREGPGEPQEDHHREALRQGHLQQHSRRQAKRPAAGLSGNYNF